MDRAALLDLFEYCDLSGILTWKHRPISHFSSERKMKSWNTTYAGKRAGSHADHRKANSYRAVVIHGKRYLEHRIIWTMVNGEIPEAIDHYNGNRSDNRISNLSNVTVKQNNKNIRKKDNNKSGVTGVHLYKPTNKWTAQIRVDKVAIYLGYFDDWFEAVCARKSANNKHGFHANHGQDRI